MSTALRPVAAAVASRADADASYDAICARGNLTRRQLFVWAGGRVAAGRPVFTEGVLLHIHGSLEVSRFVRAWQRVVDESDALRSVITDDAGWPKRDVAPRASSVFDVVDLADRTVPAAALEDLARERFDRCGQAGGPLVDALLVRLAPEHHVWVLVQHQLVSDSWSFRLVHRRMDAHYRQYPAAETALALPSFDAYVDHERRLSASFRREAADRHWRRCYGGSQGQIDPPAVSGGRDATRISRVVCRLGAARSLALRRLGAEVAASDVGLFVACASMVAMHVHRTTGARDVVLAVPFANRSSERFKQTIGSFMNVCPMRVAIEGSDRVRDLLARVARETWEAARHQWYANRPGVVPQPYDVLVNVHRSVVGAHTFADRPMDVAALPPTHRFGAVLVAVHDFGDTGELSLVLDFNERIFAATERAEFVASVLRVIDAALADPDRRLGDVCGRIDAPSEPSVPTRGAPGGAGAVGAIGTDVVRGVASIWSALLQIPTVDGGDDFFALGGNSLVLYRMLLEVERRFAVAVPVERFLADPTVEGLARVVAAGADPAVDVEAVLREVEALSNEEAAQLLSAGGGGPADG